MENEEKSAYDAMAQAVQRSVDDLLIPFGAASEGAVATTSAEEFFQKFLVYADRFTAHCCQEFSKILRQASLVPEVRGTPTVQLAKEIRTTIFEPLDKTLAAYVEALKQINLDLRGVASSLSESSVLGEALKGAAIGRVAGGFGDSGKVLGAVGALAAAGKEVVKQAALQEEQRKLIADAKNLAFAKILEYLKAVDGVAENLLDYGCAKCFGGKIDFLKQAQAVQTIQASTKANLEQALNFTLQIQKDELARVEKAAAVEVAERQKASDAAEKASNKGCGGCLVVLGGLFTFGAISMSLESAASADPGAIAVGLGIGISLVVVGIFFWKKRRS